MPQWGCNCCWHLFTAVLLLQNGKTEYKSVTVAEDSTAEEFMDFYLDDDTRATWVSTDPLSEPRTPPSWTLTGLSVFGVATFQKEPRASPGIGTVL